jgi:hypothetical protein
MYWKSRGVEMVPRSSMITWSAWRRPSSSWLVSAGFAWSGGCPCNMGCTTGWLEVTLTMGENSWVGLVRGEAGEIFESSGCPHWIRAVFANSLRSRLLACWQRMSHWCLSSVVIRPASSSIVSHCSLLCFARLALKRSVRSLISGPLRLRLSNLCTCTFSSLDGSGVFPGA